MSHVPRQVHLEQVTIQAGDTLARVAPVRGGLVTAFRIGAHDALYMDDDSFADATRPVQGGIPFLFPNAEALTEDLLRVTGTKLPKHGFARWQAWQVINRGAAILTLELRSTDAVAEQYPFDFVLSATLQVAPHRLRIDMRVANQGTKPMPVASGWHPYLAIPHAEKAHLTSHSLGIMATHIHDSDEVAFSVPFGGSCDITLVGHQTMLRASNQHKVLRIWSLPGRDFLCCEPWIGPIDALNHPEERLTVHPGGTEHLWMELAFDG